MVQSSPVWPASSPIWLGKWEVNHHYFLSPSDLWTSHPNQRSPVQSGPFDNKSSFPLIELKSASSKTCFQTTTTHDHLQQQHLNLAFGPVAPETGRGCGSKVSTDSIIKLITCSIIKFINFQRGSLREFWTLQISLCHGNELRTRWWVLAAGSGHVTEESRLLGDDGENQ